MGTQLPSPKGAYPQFSSHICCRQMAALIKMSLGMELGLGPGEFVLDGDSAPLPKRGAEPQIFGPCLLWPNGWMEEAGTWHGGRPQPRRLCVRWGPSPLEFRPMFIIVLVISIEHCTMHSCCWFVQIQVQVLVFYAFCF